MRSQVEAAHRLSALLAALPLAALLAGSPGSSIAAVSPSTVAPTSGEAPRDTRPTDAQVRAALGQLQEDPNLGAPNKSRTLQWKSSDKPDRPDNRGSWLEVIGDAFRWVATTARALLWVAGIVTVGLLALYIKRFLELRGGERVRPLQFAMPTHVRELDIRPDSLPEEIGASALESWERGQHRAALSLLYRGMLSRLAHVHGAPIRDSSTEGDCLLLARSYLQPAPSAYVAQLIRVWQRSVYGNLEPSTEEMRSLCARFEQALGKPPLTVAGQAA